MARIVDPQGREVEVLRRLVSFENRDVLDIGCGEGRTARNIARTARLVVGIDPDAGRIAEARRGEVEEGACEVEFLVEDAVTFDRPAASLDAVIFTRSL